MSGRAFRHPAIQSARSQFRTLAEQVTRFFRAVQTVKLVTLEAAPKVKFKIYLAHSVIYG